MISLHDLRVSTGSEESIQVVFVVTWSSLEKTTKRRWEKASNLERRAHCTFSAVVFGYHSADSDNTCQRRLEGKFNQFCAR